MDALTKYNEKVQRLDNAIKFKANDRVPIYGLIDNWVLYYSGISVKEALNNHELERDAYNQALLDFEFDAVLSPLIQLPSKAVRVLGGIAATDTEVNQIQTGLSELMKPEEYDEFISDPIKFMKEKIIVRRHPDFLERSAEDNYKLIQEYQAINGVRGKQNFANMQTLKNEIGTPPTYCATSFTPTDFILDYLRDFKGIMADIRRMPEKVNEASLALLEPILKMVEAANPTPQYDKLLPIFTHIPGFLNPKSFERVYWQQFKKYITHFTDKGYRWGILFEKNWDHLYDFLKDLPEKHILGFFEEDDICKAKAALDGTIAVAGGIRTNDLLYKSPEECVDIIKNVIDVCAPGSGFVLSPDKVMHTSGDGKKECLHAVVKFAKEYGKY